jgi:acetyltransferase
VLKLHSEAITHKTDVGGVQLNIKNGMEVREAFRRIHDSVLEKAGEFDPSGQPNFLGVTVQPMAKLDGYELILGSSIDPQFGPVLLFGLGGQLVEVFKDRALGLPPLNSTLARRMMERTKIYTALKGVRGRPPVDMASLELLMVRFSQLIAEQRWIKELDINPLLASPDQLLALDARVLLYGAEVDESDLPRLAIRPYPSQYISGWISKENVPVTIRPIRAEDEPLMVEFHKSLSDRSVYMRYMHPMLLGDRAAHERLSRICHGDYNREITLVADRENAEPGDLRIIGVARLSKRHTARTARFSMLISDQFQGGGIGRVLFDRLIDVARQEKVRQLEAVMAAENQAMRRMCERRGFKITEQGEGMLHASLDLS